MLASVNLTSGYLIRRLSFLDNQDMPSLVGVNALSLRLPKKQCPVLSKRFDMTEREREWEREGEGEKERKKES